MAYNKSDCKIISFYHKAVYSSIYLWLPDWEGLARSFGDLGARFTLQWTIRVPPSFAHPVSPTGKGAERCNDHRRNVAAICVRYREWDQFG